MLTPHAIAQPNLFNITASYRSPQILSQVEQKVSRNLTNLILSQTTMAGSYKAIMLNKPAPVPLFPRKQKTTKKPAKICGLRTGLTHHKNARMIQSSAALRPCIFPTLALYYCFLFLSFFSFKNGFQLKKEKPLKITGHNPGLSSKKACGRGVSRFP